MTAPGLVIHIAGPMIQVGSQRRQRCSWCGVVLEDMDLARVAVEIQYDPDGEEIPSDGPPGWPVGELIGVDNAGVVATAGDMSLSMGSRYVVAHEDGAVLPPECCAQLPHELTGGTHE